MNSNNQPANTNSNTLQSTLGVTPPAATAFVSFGDKTARKKRRHNDIVKQMLRVRESTLGGSMDAMVETGRQSQVETSKTGGTRNYYFSNIQITVGDRDLESGRYSKLLCLENSNHSRTRR
jgi:hypothetical protein